MTALESLERIAGQLGGRLVENPAAMLAFRYQYRIGAMIVAGRSWDDVLTQVSRRQSEQPTDDPAGDPQDDPRLPGFDSVRFSQLSDHAKAAR
jgi:hypothetical protein